LVKLISVAETNILNWEKDRTRPGEKYIAKMVSFFGVKGQASLQLGK